MISPRDDMSVAVVERLIGAARRSAKPAGDVQPDATDYPFDRPNRFTRAQIDRLARFAVRAAEAASARLGRTFQASLSLCPAPWRQHFAGPLKRSAPASLKHVIALAGDGGASLGWVGISAAAASNWLARLLGGCETPSADDAEPRELSDLERDLLLDIAAGIVEAVAGPAAEMGLNALAPARELSSWSAACTAGEADEMCLLELSPAPGAPAAAAICLAASAAAVLAGEVPAPKAPLARAPKAPPPALAHVERAPIEARAMLSGSALMRDVIALAPGDVLVLDQRIDDAVDVEVDGRVVMKCHPARQDGHVALCFAEFVQKK